MSRTTIGDLRTGAGGFSVQQMRNFMHTNVEVPLLIRLLDLPDGGDVLETGCGAGLGLMALAENRRPASLTGIDIDTGLLDDARSRFSVRGLPASFVHGDIRDLPFPDGSFDLVMDFGTLYYIRHARQALTEIARVLRQGGVLVHETPLSQLLAHPVASTRSRLPWEIVPRLCPLRNAGLWASRVNVGELRAGRRA
jgi:ubiquinone/menaquinone biosynthesis C-methylase UbiE